MPDTLDILTLVEAYDAINDPASASAGSGANDDRLARLITAVSRRIDKLCGPVVVRDVTEYHDGWQSDLDNLRTSVFLRETPVYSVTTVTEYNFGTPLVLDAETASNLPGNAYLLDSRGHLAELFRRAAGTDMWFPYGRRNIVVAFKAGRYLTTADVDMLFKSTAGIILRRLWSRDAGRWASGGDPFNDDARERDIGFFKAVDPLVKEFLGSELRGEDNGILLG